MKSICCYFRLGMQPTVDCLEAVATWINDRNCQENAKECETLPLVIPNLDMNWGEWLAYYSQPAANSTDVLRSIWLQNRGPQIFHKSMIHLKIPDVRTVAWSRFSTEYPERSCATVQNLLVRKTWLPAFVLPCTTIIFSSSKKFISLQIFFLLSFLIIERYKV